VAFIVHIDDVTQNQQFNVIASDSAGCGMGEAILKFGDGFALPHKSAQMLAKTFTILSKVSKLAFMKRLLLILLIVFAGIQVKAQSADSTQVDLVDLFIKKKSNPLPSNTALKKSTLFTFPS
jgi:hypothetical protein